jgi:O-methyltransferase domain/Dimerisation domain
MSARPISSAPGAPPWLALGRLVSGYAVSQMIYAASELGIPELLRDGPKSAEELARLAGANADLLRRVMRGLTAVGVLAQDEEGRFGLAPDGRFLCDGAPGSLRALVKCAGEAYQAWGALLHSLRTGETPFEHVFGVDRFAYLTSHPEAAVAYDEAMSGLSSQLAASVLAAYDFSQFGSVVDVGGGSGALLLPVLEANASARGVIYDRPSMVEGARARVEARGLAGRCEVRGGDFFESVPEGGDAYVLSHVIHNWDDERAAAILRNCRRAMAEGARLLLVEMLMPERPSGSPAVYPLGMTDLQGRGRKGGRERTRDEFASLMASAGFELTRTIPTNSLDSVIEAVPADSPEADAA